MGKEGRRDGGRKRGRRRKGGKEGGEGREEEEREEGRKKGSGGPGGKDTELSPGMWLLGCHCQWQALRRPSGWRYNCVKQGGRGCPENRAEVAVVGSER